MLFNINQKVLKNKTNKPLHKEAFKYKSQRVNQRSEHAPMFYSKKITYAGFDLFELWDVRFPQQNSDVELELQIENKLKSTKWKNDFKSIAALFVLITILALVFYVNIYNWYEINFKEEAQETYSIFVIEYSLKASLVDPITLIFPTLTTMNCWLAEVLISVFI